MAEMIEQIVAPDVPEPVPNIFSNCLKIGNQLFISGMTAAGPDGAMAGGDSAYGQAQDCFRKIRDMVEAAGGQMTDVVKLTIYLTDMADRPELGRARQEFFSGRMPCSTLVGISTLVNPAMRVEIEATAILGASGA